MSWNEKKIDKNKKCLDKWTAEFYIYCKIKVFLSYIVSLLKVEKLIKSKKINKNKINNCLAFKFFANFSKLPEKNLEQIIQIILIVYRQRLFNKIR
jgi:hypothetical protein